MIETLGDAKTIISRIDHELSIHGVTEATWRKIMIPIVDRFRDDPNIHAVANPKIRTLRMELAVGIRSWLSLVDITSSYEDGVEYWTVRCNFDICPWSMTKDGDAGHDDILRKWSIHAIDHPYINVVLPPWALFAPGQWRYPR